MTSPQAWEPPPWCAIDRKALLDLVEATARIEEKVHEVLPMQLRRIEGEVVATRNQATRTNGTVADVVERLTRHEDLHALEERDGKQYAKGWEDRGQVMPNRVRKFWGLVQLDWKALGIPAMALMFFLGRVSEIEWLWPW